VLIAIGSRPQTIVAHDSPSNSPLVGITPTRHSSTSSLHIQQIPEEEDGNALQVFALRAESADTNLTSALLYKKIKDMPSTTTITLGGISKEAVEKIIIAYSGFPIKYVQEKVIKLFQFSFDQNYPTNSIGIASHRNYQENWRQSFFCRKAGY